MTARWTGAVTFLAILGCGGGFMEDGVLSGEAAREAIAATAKDELPAGASDLRFVQSTSIDWIINAEFSAPRSEADPWFEALVLRCQPSTIELEVDEHGISFFRFLGDDAAWSVPTERLWRVKHCDSSAPTSSTYTVAVTLDGDPAWFWVTVKSF